MLIHVSIALAIFDPDSSRFPMHNSTFFHWCKPVEISVLFTAVQFTNCNQVVSKFKLLRAPRNSKVLLYHRFRWHATFENKTPAETFPKFPSIMHVIDRSIRSVDNTHDWRKFWKRFCGCFDLESRVSRKTVVSEAMQPPLVDNRELEGNENYTGNCGKKG